MNIPDALNNIEKLGSFSFQVGNSPFSKGELRGRSNSCPLIVRKNRKLELKALELYEYFSKLFSNDLESSAAGMTAEGMRLFPRKSEKPI